MAVNIAPNIQCLFGFNTKKHKKMAASHQIQHANIKTIYTSNIIFNTSTAETEYIYIYM